MSRLSKCVFGVVVVGVEAVDALEVVLLLTEAAQEVVEVAGCVSGFLRRVFPKRSL